MRIKKPTREPIVERVALAFEAETRKGIRHATIARTFALLATALWVLDAVDYPMVLYYLSLLGVFLALGIGHDFVARRVTPQIWPSTLFILADSALMAFMIAAGNPMDAVPLPPQAWLKLGNFVFFYMLLAGSLLTYSPRLVLWCGVSGAVAWGITVAWIINIPGSVTRFDIPGWHAMESAQIYPLLLRPNFVDIDAQLKDIFVFLVVTAILATIVRRARHMALRFARTERERANLSRHFSPNMVDTLASSDEPLGAVRRQRIAVLFADIVGFSGLAERLGPEQTMGLLRKTHSLVAEQIFAHDGTLDKYIGDAVMATFGVPVVGPDDAANAIACAKAIQAALATNNPLENEPVKLGIGAHFGEVVMGDIGGERRLEFGVIGDTVNVASRLESLTRALGPIVISDELYAAAGGRTGPADGFRQVPGQKLRGREEPIDIWVLDGNWL